MFFDSMILSALIYEEIEDQNYIIEIQYLGTGSKISNEVSTVEGN
jgi:hypothetical protein